MLYSPNVRKKLESTATKTHSRTSNRTASTETFSLIGTNVSDDEYKSDKSQSFQGSANIRPTRSYTRSNSNHELSMKLRNTFADLIEDKNNDLEVIDKIKSQFDKQTVRIRRLERALKEKEDQSIKEDNNEDTISLLLVKYPNSMKSYKKQIEENQFNEQLETCIEQFETQKEKMILEHQRNFEILKLKYRNRFDDIVERMISDPSRLDDEWAKRIQREANDRIEEIKKKYSSG